MQDWTGLVPQNNLLLSADIINSNPLQTAPTAFQLCRIIDIDKPSYCFKNKTHKEETNYILSHYHPFSSLPSKTINPFPSKLIKHKSLTHVYSPEIFQLSNFQSYLQSQNISKLMQKTNKVYPSSLNFHTHQPPPPFPLYAKYMNPPIDYKSLFTFITEINK